MAGSREQNLPPQEPQQTRVAEVRIHNLQDGIPNEVPFNTNPNPHSKPCDLCQRPRDVLIRCQIDEAKKWHFVCTGQCWKNVSGGQVEGTRDHPLYRYGGMWKNKHDAVSAKIKGKAKAKNKELHEGHQGPHRRHGHWRPMTKKSKGEVDIGDDDGASDIAVSDLSDGEGLSNSKGTQEVGQSGIQIQKTDE